MKRGGILGLKIVLELLEVGKRRGGSASKPKLKMYEKNLTESHPFLTYLKIQDIF